MLTELHDETKIYSIYENEYEINLINLLDVKNQFK